jgi:threonine dehydrogenase-like Zn-dependent dehydrogenase
MEKGDVLGHGMTGEVVEISAEVTNFKVGDCVVVPFTIFYSECLFCKRGFYSGFEGSYSNHKLAEYPRVPYADIGPIKFPENLTDDQVLVNGLINKAAAIAANDLPECFDSGRTTHD